MYLVVSYVCFWRIYFETAVDKREFYANSFPKKWFNNIIESSSFNIAK